MTYKEAIELRNRMEKLASLDKQADAARNSAVQRYRQGLANGTAKPTVSLRLHYLPAARFDNPKYYIHFTLSRLGDDGWPQLLTFPEEATWRSHFANGADLEPGNYVLTTGTRMASGKVLASMQRFTLRADTTISFTLRETKAPSRYGIASDITFKTVLDFTRILRFGSS